MTTTDAAAAYYDPYDVAINADPYPAFAALRAEAPVYHNEVHDFWALSRFEDIDRALRDHERFISGRGGILELIKAGIPMPPGILIFEDPPTHTVHRRLLSRVFTPKRVAELEPKVREFCVQCLDPLVGEDGFDFIAHLGAQVPMKTISMLLGIPESDQEYVRDKVDASLRTEEGQPMQVSESLGRKLHRLADRTTVRLHGACIGSGIELAAFAGTVDAAPDVMIGLPEVSMGLIPGAGGTVSVTRRIGRHRTCWLALTGRRVDAMTALEWGLVDTVGPTDAG